MRPISNFDLVCQFTFFVIFTFGDLYSSSVRAKSTGLIRLSEMIDIKDVEICQMSKAVMTHAKSGLKF